jgi:hypothetical protein
MTISTRVLRNGAVLALSIGTLLVLARSGNSQGGGPRNLPFIRQLPLDNGSLQDNLPGNIATLPLFLRNGGHFGFGAGAFGMLQAAPPAGGVIIPPSQQLGAAGAVGAGGAIGALGGMTGCQGTGFGGLVFGGIGGIGGQQGQQNAFFPCSLQQGQFPGALVQRIVQDGFFLQYGVAVVPQIMGGIPTLPVQMGTGFGGLKGNLFLGNQLQQQQGNLGAIGGKIGIGGFAGSYGCY